ncbi:hypothetical protein ABZ722_30700 [Streptomyces longwoodensis]
MSTQDFKGAYLLPLFHAIEQARGEHSYRRRPAAWPPTKPRWARTRLRT